MRIAVVICTFNRAAMLARALDALAAQRGVPRDDWAVVVVDNNSTDETARVVEREAARGRIPGLRRVWEGRQGLTAARLRGVLETAGEWVAFVDDDCLVADDWVLQALRFADLEARCGAFGSRVVLEWESSPRPALLSYGWLLAEQDHGDEAARAPGVAGAGMVVRRRALESSGWTRGPLLGDRVGERLVSGGDVEIGARVLALGYELWYQPACRLRHVIPPERSTRRYMAAIARGLGRSASYSDALVGAPSTRGWLAPALRATAADAVGLARRGAGVVLRGRDPDAALMDASFALGRIAGRWSILRAGRDRRRELLGRARPGAHRAVD